MKQKIACFSLLVNDYDEAIAYYTEILGFELLEDTKLSDTKRWVRVAPFGATETSILLAKAANELQTQFVGNQSGGRVFLFLHTDDFWRDYNCLIQKKVEFIRQPSEESYGIVAVFRDLYGNLWDLVSTSSTTEW